MAICRSLLLETTCVIVVHVAFKLRSLDPIMRHMKVTYEVYWWFLHYVHTDYILKTLYWHFNSPCFLSGTEAANTETKPKMVQQTDICSEITLLVQVDPATSLPVAEHEGFSYYKLNVKPGLVYLQRAYSLVISKSWVWYLEGMFVGQYNYLQKKLSLLKYPFFPFPAKNPNISFL